MTMADESKIWTARDYILAALGGTLAATALVIVVSVLLSPADISFSIVHFSNTSCPITQSLHIPKYCLNLTIAAANASRKRAAVRYQSVFVGRRNSTARVSLAAVRVDAKPPAIINASWVRPPRGTSRRGYPEYSELIVVVVEAQVRFRIGGIPTRLYNIKVSCPHVLWVGQEGSGNSSPLPIDCRA